MGASIPAGRAYGRLGALSAISMLQCLLREPVHTERIIIRAIWVEQFRSFASVRARVLTPRGTFSRPYQVSALFAIALLFVIPISRRPRNPRLGHRIRYSCLA